MYSIIVAIDKHNAIGYNGHLLCTLHTDLKRFKQITDGHAIIMGHATYLSLPIKPLPNRLNIVLSHIKHNYTDVIVASSIDEVNTIINKKNLTKAENFIIGGEQIYRVFLPYCEKLYVTHINNTWNKADAFFPPIDPNIWKSASLEHFDKSDMDEYSTTFVIYEKINIGN